MWWTPAWCRTQYSFRQESIVQATHSFRRESIVQATPMSTVLNMKVLPLVFFISNHRSILACRRIFVGPQHVRIFQQRLHFSFSSARSHSLAGLYAENSPNFIKGRHASLVYPSLGLSPAVSDGVQLTSFEDTGGAKVRLCRPINSLRLSVNSPHLLFQRCRTKMFRGKGVSLLMILQVWHLTAPTCVKGLAIDRQRPSSQDPLR
jgi:hypothetical protein